MRIKSIDFLRGIAILLVLCRHMEYTAVTHLIGWCGVDLFFVLSGFLVSGLLFKEYKENNNLQPLLFLIRRGFKIYPMFWGVLIIIIVTHYFTGFGTSKQALMAELLFYQNYSTHTLLSTTWSLAVEEHFYILLIAGVSLAVKYNVLLNSRGFHYVVGSVLLFCLLARIVTSIVHPQYNFLVHYAPTHLRIDALTFGVILAYNYHFNAVWFTLFFNRYRYYIIAAVVVFLAPVFLYDAHTVYMRTIGFSFVYLGFGGLISLMLCVSQVSITLQKILSKHLYSLVSTIGYYSYAIYLFHTQIVIGLAKLGNYVSIVTTNNHVQFGCYLLLSILSGTALTYLIERPALATRQYYFAAGTNLSLRWRIQWPYVPQVQFA